MPEPSSSRAPSGLTFNYSPPYNSGSFGSPDMGCSVDRVPTPCDKARQMIAGGVAVPCPNNDCGARMVGGELKLPYYSDEDGFSYGRPGSAGRAAPTLKRATAEERAGMRRTVRARGRDPFGVGYSETVGFLFSGFSFREMFLLGASTTTDPCAGQKTNLLEYDNPRKKPDRYGNKTAREHITYNHINKNVLPDKSKYLIADSLPEQAKFAIVQTINQVTFYNATGYRSGNMIAYVYALGEMDVNPTSIPIPYRLSKYQPLTGQDGETRRYTNLNTLIVSQDCKTVITSYPGLPSGLWDPNDPRISGNPVWVSPHDPRIIGPLLP